MKKEQFRQLENLIYALALVGMSLPIALYDFDMASWVFGLQAGFVVVGCPLLVYSVVAVRRISRYGYGIPVADVEHVGLDDRKATWLTGIGIFVIAALLMLVFYWLPVKSHHTAISGFLLAGLVDAAIFSLVTSLIWKWFILPRRNNEQGEACD